jgi:hypothetical protein
VNRPVESGASIWFIQAAGRVWGPYPETRMTSFVDEGRVAPDTLVGARPEGPFAPAAHQMRLRSLFGAADTTESAPTPAPPATAQVQAPVQGQAEAGVARALLVSTTLVGPRADSFEALLGAHGPFVRIQPGLWLVRAPMSPASLRNVLTRRLEAGDSVMVIAAALDQAAWFNLEGEIDRTLRSLWMD